MAIIKNGEESDLDYGIDFGGEEKEKVGVLFRIVEVRTDPLQYKPLNPAITPAEDLYIQLEVDKEEVLQYTDETVKVITVEGFAKMLIQYGDKIQETFDKEN